MKNLKKRFIWIPAIITITFFISCNNHPHEEEITVKQDSIPNEEEPSGSNYETFFQVPSPGEMLTFIKSVGKKDLSKLSTLNSPENITKYTDTKSKALNFGIYSTDLSYCSIFNMGAESIKYFKSVKQLGDQLGLSSIIKPEILSKLEKNIDNIDSLSQITDDLYYSTFETLDESKQGETLALIVAGGWLESVYIAVQMTDKFSPENRIIQRIADQKYTLENLIEFLKKHETHSEDVKQVKQDLENLMNSFQLLKEEKVTDNGIKQKDNKKLLTGGVNLVITEKTFNDIKSKIISLRNQYTQNQ